MFIEGFSFDEPRLMSGRCKAILFAAMHVSTLELPSLLPNG
jgi:hypothetical protein